MSAAPTLSVITASHRNLSGLRLLLEAIAPIDPADMEWIIKDSGACSKTTAWGVETQNAIPSIRFLNEGDLGIYDALNRALEVVRGQYYLVVGSDDHVTYGCLKTLIDALKSGRFEGAKLIALPVVIGGAVRFRRPWLPIWISAGSIVASHSVGVVIDRSLHDRLGPYDLRFPILADSHFLVRAHQAEIQVVDYKGPPIGEFSTGGVSSTNHASRIVEAFLYNYDCGHAPVVQAALAALRLIRHFPRRKQYRLV